MHEKSLNTKLLVIIRKFRDINIMSDSCIIMLRTAYMTRGKHRRTMNHVKTFPVTSR